MITIKTPVSRVGNKSSLLPIIYATFPLKFDRFVDLFGGSGSVLLGKPEVHPFEVYNDFDRNLVNLFRCMKERPLAVIRELGFCNLNSRDDFNVLKRFFTHETFNDAFLSEELRLTEILLPPPSAEELKELQNGIVLDYDVRKAAMYLKLLRYSYSSGCKSFASQPFDIRKLFGLIRELEDRLANVIIENQDFEVIINHYDKVGTLIYGDPPYFMSEKMYATDFGWDDHVRLKNAIDRMTGKALISYNDCPEIRGLYKDYFILDFSRTHAMAQRYEPGKQFNELLIGNYDLLEREREKPRQLSLFTDPREYDHEKILKESIISCKIKR